MTQERDINLLAECIAGVLGAGWNLEGKSEGRSNIITNKSLRIYLSLGYGSQSDRLSVHGTAPQDFYQRQLGRDIIWPQITVSADKSAEQIAKDIQRRVIPGTEAATVMAQQAIDKDKNYKSNRKALAQEFCEIFEIPFKPDHNGEAPEVIYSGKGGSFDIQLSSDGQGIVRGTGLYVTPEQLRKIKSVCPELFGKGKQ